MKFNGIELHVGDRVKLTNKRPLWWNLDGFMDMYLGKVVTIKYPVSDESFIVEKDYGDNIGCWVFRVNDIVEATDCKDPISKDLSNIHSTSYTAKIKIGNLEINLTDKTFTDEQIKNMKEMLGWDVENLVGGC